MRQRKKIINIVTICFFGYLSISLILALKEVVLDSDWNQMLKQYSTVEVIIMYFIYIIGRCCNKKFRNYFNIYWSYIWY